MKGATPSWVNLFFIEIKNSLNNLDGTDVITSKEG